MDCKTKHEGIMKPCEKVSNALDKAQLAKQITTSVGFELSDSVENAFLKIDEEFHELSAEIKKYITTQENKLELQKELGDLIFSLCSLANKINVRAEECLELTIDKFIFRTSYVEQKLKEHGKDFSSGELQDMCAWWEEAKKFK